MPWWMPGCTVSNCPSSTPTRAGPTTSAYHPAFTAKRQAAALVRERDLPLGINVVLHRHNLDALDALMELAVAWDADRIELANAQFYGWGLLNRAALMPSREQLAAAGAQVEAWKERLDGTLEITWVVPDYFSGTPKPCMGGWGAVSLTVTPDGTTLPCPAAATLPGLDAPNATERPLRWIWEESPAFNAYRGTDWMPDPCRSCERRTEDFGGAAARHSPSPETRPVPTRPVHCRRTTRP